MLVNNSSIYLWMINVKMTGSIEEIFTMTPAQQAGYIKLWFDILNERRKNILF